MNTSKPEHTQRHRGYPGQTHLKTAIYSSPHVFWDSPGKGSRCFREEELCLLQLNSLFPNYIWSHAWWGNVFVPSYYYPGSCYSGKWAGGLQLLSSWDWAFQNNRQAFHWNLLLPWHLPIAGITQVQSCSSYSGHANNVGWFSPHLSVKREGILLQYKWWRKHHQLMWIDKTIVECMSFSDYIFWFPEQTYCGPHNILLEY